MSVRLLKEARHLAVEELTKYVKGVPTRQVRLLSRFIPWRVIYSHGRRLEQRFAYLLIHRPRSTTELLLCEVAHGLAKELRARVYGLFGFEDAGHRVGITDDASALRMLSFVTRREMTDVSVVRWGSGIVLIGLMDELRL